MASVPPPVVYPHPGAPPQPPERPEGIAPRAPRWAPWTAPVALIAGFAGAIFGAVLVGAVGAATGADISDPPPAVNILATVFQGGALIASALLFARMAGRPRPWHFGLRATRLGPAIGWLLLAWLTFIVFSAAWVSALGLESEDELPSELGADESTIALVAVGVLVTVIAPIAEEFFFRAYFFGALRNWKGVWPAAILTGLVFGGIHAGSSPVGFLVPLAFFGFVLCLLYARTRSLYPCIVLHALNNALAFSVSQDWDWQIPLVMLGANALIFMILLPITRRAGPAPALPAGARA